MQNHTTSMRGKTALITGAARRIGAEIARLLHSEGLNLCLHYGTSYEEASTLAGELNELRADSAFCVQADLQDLSQLESLAKAATSRWGRLDHLINNASSFFATPRETSDQSQWQKLINTNLRAPYVLANATADALRESGGSIVNIADIYGIQPRIDYGIYCLSKAGVIALTKSLALELAPQVRCNAVAPGAILWPEADPDPELQDKIIAETALGRLGDPADIAAAVKFLLNQSSYMTGQVLRVDGGRSLSS